MKKLYILIVGCVVLLLCAACQTTTNVAVEEPETSTFSAGQRLGTIYFSAESAALSAEAEAAIQAIAQRVSSEEGVVLVATGHTALRGTSRGRSALSRRRAEAVASRLRAEGVPTVNIEFYGGERPAADNTREGIKLNRRVEVRVQ